MAYNKPIKGNPEGDFKSEREWVESNLDKLRNDWKAFLKDTQSDITFDDYTRALWNDHAKGSGLAENKD
ncbi:MAG: hypothetical protein IM613_17165 [Cytophagales bacterium]|nr:hypothetical protein [Cytophagales bacterium]